DTQDETHLRELVMSVRLRELVDDLIYPERLNTTDSSSSRASVFDPDNAIWIALSQVILASHLNATDIERSFQRFAHEPSRDKQGIQEFTSLALFSDDLERLLRDLYGEADKLSIERLVSACFVIVDELTRYSHPDLHKEHDEAQTIDRGFW